MDSSIPKSAPIKKSKLSRTFHKVISLKTASKIASNNGICKLKPHNKATKEEQDIEKMEDLKAKNKAVMEAFLAKLFAEITSIKASYAELQMAQEPYDNEGIQVADQRIVDELKSLSELKRSFMKKELHFSPQVTLMLAEIQEQHGLMKTYEITIKKLEAEAQRKSSRVMSLKSELEQVLATCSSSKNVVIIAKSSPVSIFDNLSMTKLTPTHFAQMHRETIVSIRSFVKIMMRAMENARWDLNTAVKFIEPEGEFVNKQSHICFVFESFVSRAMLEGFTNPSFGLFASEKSSYYFFDQFNKLKQEQSVTSFMSRNQEADAAALFSKFTRAKYMQLVHAKMECSLFGNLNQRKLVNSGEAAPETTFFEAFAEMSMKIWLLHCLAFSFGDKVSIFQVSKRRSFSEMFMEYVTVNDNDSDKDFSVSFTVVPGFMIGNMVFQSLVYLSKVKSSSSSSSLGR